MRNARPDWLQEIDHTGDVGIVVTAPDRNRLYARAAVGLFWVLTDVEAVRDREAVDVSVEAADPESLMVRWLSELNFLHATQNVLFRRFDVDIRDTADGLHLDASAYGEPIDRDRHTVFTEIKAVTFHDMNVEDTGTGWRVQVIFDM
jgi:SHS2 domain-containing protein